MSTKEDSMSAIMTSRQAAELDHAFERNDWTPADVKELSKGDTLKSIRAVVRGRAEVVIRKILDRVTTVSLPAQPRFAVRDHFKVDTSAEAAVRIDYLGDNFKVWFLGRTEEPVGEFNLAVHKLIEEALDAPILEELGERAEVTLAQFWALLKVQGKGESGSLLTNGYANVAYIRDANGDLRAVSAVWSGVHHGWVVYAFSVGSPDGWDAGRQVVSRK